MKIYRHVPVIPLSGLIGIAGFVYAVMKAPVKKVSKKKDLEFKAKFEPDFTDM